MLQKSSSSSWMYWISGIAQYCRDEAQGKRAANTITIRACMKATEYLVGTIRTCTCMIATEYLVGTIRTCTCTCMIATEYLVGTIRTCTCMIATEYLVGTIRTCTCMIATEYLVSGTSVAQNTGSEVGYVSCNLLYHHSPAHTHTHTTRGGVDITPQPTSPVS